MQLFFSRLFDFLAMLIQSRQKKHLIPSSAMIAAQNIRQDSRIGMPYVRSIIDIKDGS